MAFQIPLMRSDYDIYKMNNAKSRPIAAGNKNSRSHKVSESHSYSTSPGQNDAFIGGSPSHRNLHHVHSAGGRFSRVNSRTSQSSLIMSPTKSQSMNNPSPPKPAKSGSQTSLHKFSLVDRIKKVFKSGSSEESSRSWKSHSIDLSSPFRRPSSEVNKKLVSASSVEIAALERQFQLIQTDSDEDESSDSDEHQQNHCGDKFILI